MTELSHGALLVLPSLSMTFRPEAWNDIDLMPHVNCLAYALNEPRTAFPYVGNLIRTGRTEPKKRHAHERLMRNFTKVANGHLSYDLQLRFHGLERIRKHQFEPEKRHIIAFSPYLGHFFRLDGNNLWSHKSGITPARNTDNNGNIIEDLELADIDLPPSPNRDIWEKRDLAYYFQKIDEVERERQRNLASQSFTGRIRLGIQDYLEKHKEPQQEITLPRLRFDASEILYYALPKHGIAVTTNFQKFEKLCEISDRLGL